MNIFSKRPLSLILCIMLGGFSLFAFFENKFKFLLFVLPLLIISFSFIKKIKSYALILRLSAFILAISLLASHLYFDRWFKAYERFGDEEVILEGEVVSVGASEYSYRIDVKTYSINDEPLTKYKIIIYLDSEEYNVPNPGDVVTVMGSLSGFERGYTDFDAKTYYFSQGYSAELRDPEFFEITGHVDIKPSIFTSIRSLIFNKINSLTSEDAAGLFIALFLGDKSMLSQKLAFDFSRIGLSHALALSGMHLAIIVLGLSKLTSLIGVGKKARTALIIPFTVTYMLLTGLPVSVVRAGLMLIISSLLYLIAKTRDSLTTLFISVSMICLFNPESIFDLSLWLSAFATFGIVSMSDYQPQYKPSVGVRERLKSFVFGSFSVSFYAVSATLLISIFYFNTVSVISPVSTFIFSIPIELFLYLGIFTLIFGSFIPSGKLLSLLTKFIFDTSDALSNPRYIAVSSEFVLLKILIILFTLLFLLFLVLEIKRKRTALTVLVSFFLLICISAPFLSLHREIREEIIYQRHDKTESITVTGLGEITLIDEDAHRGISAHYTAAAAFHEKLSYLDNYVICNYSNGLTEKLGKMLTRIKIYNIYVPEPQNSAEEEILDSLRIIAKTNKCELSVYGVRESLNIGYCDFQQDLRLPYTLDGSRNIFTLNCNGEKISYFSSNTLSGRTRAVAATVIANSNYVIFGSHGTSYDEYYLTYDLDNAKAIIFSSKNMKVSNYVMEKYKNMELYFEPERVEIIR